MNHLFMIAIIKAILTHLREDVNIVFISKTRKRLRTVLFLIEVILKMTRLKNIKPG